MWHFGHSKQQCVEFCQHSILLVHLIFDDANFKVDVHIYMRTNVCRMISASFIVPHVY